MLNAICSPEMDLSSDIEAEPHVYVQYAVDDERASIPLKFLKEFPRNWRENGWKRTYLYKAFWSPDATDSPAEMLKRVPAIPVFEKDCAVFSKPGYYRASVLAVAESKGALESMVESKRLSVGLVKYMHTSFDEKPNRDSSKSQEGNCAGSKANSSKKKKRGINRDAQKDNTTDLKEDLSTLYPFIKTEPKSPETSGGKKSPEMVNSKKTSASCLLIKTESKLPASSGAGGKRKSAEMDDSKETSAGKKPRKTRNHFVNYRGCSGSDSDEDIVIDGRTLDPDFTPKKYVDLQEKLTASESNLTKAYDSNKKLRVSLAQVESQNLFLEEKVKNLEQELEKAKQGGSRKKLFDEGKSGSSDGDSESDDDNGKGEGGIIDPKETVSKVGTVHCSINQVCEVQIQDVKTENDNQVCDGEVETKDVKTENDNQVRDGEVETKDVKPENESSEYIIGGVSINPDVWKLIFGLPTGPKKDIKFIKDLSTVVHGPETLAASSIFGTLRGGNNSKIPKEERTPKPALSKKLLAAVRGELIKRVEKDEGKAIPEDDHDSHPRTKPKFYHEAIRGAQKRLKILGYGEGRKSNTISTDILKSTE